MNRMDCEANRNRLIAGMPGVDSTNNYDVFACEDPLKSHKQDPLDEIRREMQELRALIETRHEAPDDASPWHGMGQPECIKQTIDERPTLPEGLLPEDVFSFIVTVDFTSFSFWGVCLGTFVLQFGTLVLLLLDSIDLSDEKNNPYEPYNPLGIPPAVDLTVATSQLLALLISIISQNDVLWSLTILMNGYDEEDIVVFTRKGLPRYVGVRWYASLGLRLLEGSLALIVTFLLIVQSETVRDVLLNFTAVEFISQIDNSTFVLAKWGYFGEKAKHDAENPIISEHNFTIRKTLSYRSYHQWGDCRDPNIFLAAVYRLGIISCAIATFAKVTSTQQSGKLLPNEIYVQFGDAMEPELGSFSGIYRRHGRGASHRFQYIEVLSETGFFEYCDKFNAWTFLDLSKCSNCEECWVLKSPATDSYNILSLDPQSWVFYERNGVSYLVDHLHMSWYYQQRPCLDNEFGPNCEYMHVCTSIVVDAAKGIFQDNRAWSASFEALEGLKVYDRPAYYSKYSEEEYDLVYFWGRRWVMESVTGDLEGIRHRLINFRAHEYMNAKVAFMSEPTDVGTPGDQGDPVHLQWYRTSELEETNGQNTFPRADRTRMISAGFYCRTCGEQNPCLFNGICSEHGECLCDAGSKGALCEIPPVGNGLCNPFFNGPQYAYDGGDCCALSCHNSESFTCGKDESGVGEVGDTFCANNTLLPRWMQTNVVQSESFNSDFGSSVSISNLGNILAVGEPLLDAVHLFDRVGSEWILRYRLLGQAGSEFGRKVEFVEVAPDAVRDPQHVVPVGLLIGSTGFVSLYHCEFSCSLIPERVAKPSAFNTGGPTEPPTIDPQPSSLVPAGAVSPDGRVVAISNSGGEVSFYLSYAGSLAAVHWANFTLPLPQLTFNGTLITTFLSISTVSIFGLNVSLDLLDESLIGPESRDRPQIRFDIAIAWFYDEGYRFGVSGELGYATLSLRRFAATCSLVNEGEQWHWEITNLDGGGEGVEFESILPWATGNTTKQGEMAFRWARSEVESVVVHPTDMRSLKLASDGNLLTVLADVVASVGAFSTLQPHLLVYKFAGSDMQLVQKILLADLISQPSLLDIPLVWYHDMTNDGSLLLLNTVEQSKLFRWNGTQYNHVEGQLMEGTYLGANAISGDGSTVVVSSNGNFDDTQGFVTLYDRDGLDPCAESNASALRVTLWNTTTSSGWKLVDSLGQTLQESKPFRAPGLSYRNVACVTNQTCPSIMVDVKQNNESTYLAFFGSLRLESNSTLPNTCVLEIQF